MANVVFGQVGVQHLLGRLLDEKDGPPTTKVRADGLWPGALRQHVDEVSVSPLKSVHRNGRRSDNAVHVELGAVAIQAWRGALRDVVDNVHDLALLEVVAGRYVGERLRFRQVGLVQFGQELAKRALIRLCHTA